MLLINFALFEIDSMVYSLL